MLLHVLMLLPLRLKTLAFILADRPAPGKTGRAVL